MATPADLVREACDLLAGYLPQLAREIPEPGNTASAAPGMTARPSSAPPPGNPAAFYAKTGIDATARQLEAILKYAAGARRPGPLVTRGGSDANTVRALDGICGLIYIADDDLYQIVITELDRRLDEAQSHAAIDEAQRWRPVPARACPRCRCFFLKVLEDARGQPAGRVECFGHTEAGVPCRAAWAGLIAFASELDDLEG